MLGRVSKFEINVRLYLKICLFSLAISLRNFLCLGKYAKYHDIVRRSFFFGKHKIAVVCWAEFQNLKLMFVFT